MHYVQQSISNTFNTYNLYLNKHRPRIRLYLFGKCVGNANLYLRNYKFTPLHRPGKYSGYCKPHTSQFFVQF